MCALKIEFGSTPNFLNPNPYGSVVELTIDSKDLEFLLDEMHNFTDLKKLTIENIPVSLKQLSVLPKTLEFLWLKNCNKQSGFITKLDHLKNLKFLGLEEMPITDEGIMRVVNVAMLNLQMVQLKSTFVTSRDIIVNTHPNGQKMMVGLTSLPEVSKEDGSKYTPSFGEIYDNDLSDR